MNRTFKPQFDTLEARVTLDAAGMHCYAVAPPAADEMAIAAGADISAFAGQTIRLRIATTTNQGYSDVPNDAAAAVSGRITAVVVDPSDALETSHSDSDWLYVPVRRTALAEVDAGAIFDSRPGVGVLKSVDAGATWGFLEDGGDQPFDDNSHGTHVAGTIGAVANNSAAASHELGHILGLRHEHTRP